MQFAAWNLKLSISALLAVALLVSTSLLLFPSCNHRAPSQRETFDSFVRLGIKDSSQLRLIANLKALNLKEGESSKITFKQLFGYDFKKLLLVDRMVVNYSKPCPGLLGGAELANKELCQYGIVYKNDGSIDYVRGLCEYDLMNISKSYDVNGFTLKNPVEVCYPHDVVNVFYSSLSRAPYFIEPVIHRKAEIPTCDAAIKR